MQNLQNYSLARKGDQEGLDTQKEVEVGEELVPAQDTSVPTVLESSAVHVTGLFAIHATDSSIQAVVELSVDLVEGSEVPPSCPPLTI